MSMLLRPANAVRLFPGDPDLDRDTSWLIRYAESRNCPVYFVSHPSRAGQFRFRTRYPFLPLYLLEQDILVSGDREYLPVVISHELGHLSQWHDTDFTRQKIFQDVFYWQTSKQRLAAKYYDQYKDHREAEYQFRVDIAKSVYSLEEDAWTRGEAIYKIASCLPPYYEDIKRQALDTYYSDLFYWESILKRYIEYNEQALSNRDTP